MSKVTRAVNTILAIETSTLSCSVALSHQSRSYTRHSEESRAHAQLIMPYVDEVLAEAGIDMAQVDGIAFGCGPGSFTGVRIAISVAQGLASGRGCPLLGVSSLRILAQRAASLAGLKQVVVAQDARMDELYVGHFRIDEQGIAQPEGDERLASAGDVKLPSNCCLLGSGFEAYTELAGMADPLHSRIIVEPQWQPRASELLILAANATDDEWVAANEAKPSYVRDQVAKKSS